MGSGHNLVVTSCCNEGLGCMVSAGLGLRSATWGLGIGNLFEVLDVIRAESGLAVSVPMQFWGLGWVGLLCNGV